MKWSSRTLFAATALAACIGSASAQKTVTYYYTDPQGTPLAETDASGNVTATYDYAPYGRSVLGATDNEPGYTGHVADNDSGLVYMQARYYDPEVGRFVSSDPEKMRPGDVFASNRFSYAKNSPMVFTDPTGRCIEDACIGEAILLWEAFEFFAGAAEISEGAAVVAEGSALASEGAAATAGTATLDVGTGTLLTSNGTGTAAACVANVACGGTVTVAAAVLINKANQQLPTSQQQAEHTKGKRKSTEAKHEKGNSRRSRDQGGERGDSSRRPGRNPPPGWKGKWPPDPPPAK